MRCALPPVVRLSIILWLATLSPCLAFISSDFQNGANQLDHSQPSKGVDRLSEILSDASLIENITRHKGSSLTTSRQSSGQLTTPSGAIGLPADQFNCAAARSCSECSAPYCTWSARDRICLSQPRQADSNLSSKCEPEPPTAVSSGRHGKFTDALANYQRMMMPHICVLMFALAGVLACVLGVRLYIDARSVQASKPRQPPPAIQHTISGLYVNEKAAFEDN